ncbi:MAG: NUDIX domain-containing protein [Lachnospiraceae bacterium]|nr:NUDIX domain-containing protein [Lachnospiraceae bacterium]
MGNIGRLRNMTSIYLLCEDKMLLLYRQGSRVVNNVWIGSAGGHFEENELNDAGACVLRELEEELSITQDMICDMELRYVTLRRRNEEIRQNYYFFARFPNGNNMHLTSNEGQLKWISLTELKNFEMPFTAQYVINHYLDVGQYNHKMYGGIADGEKVEFVEMPE